MAKNKVAWFFTLVFLCSCSAEKDQESTFAPKLISLQGVERSLQFHSYVYVPTDADDASIRLAINRQLKTAFGFFNQSKLAVNDIDFAKKMAPTSWKREVLTVIDTQNPTSPSYQIQRVDFDYQDQVLASNETANTHVLTMTLLAGAYEAQERELYTDCADEFGAQTGIFWRDFRFQLPSCQMRIENESKEIQSALQELAGETGVTSSAEVNRWFITVQAKLGPEIRANRTASPEYGRLFGFSAPKDKLIIYVFGGVDFSGQDANDDLGKENLKFLRRMHQTHPDMKIVPQLESAQNLFDRWTYLEFDIQVNRHDTSKTIAVEIRSFYGNDTGTEEEKRAAHARFQEAFWNADIFIYNGHSHLGASMLHPSLYQAEHFHERYQLMVINSCSSFTYYRQGFFDQKPGGVKNLDMIVNGGTSAILNSGEVLANFLNGLFEQKNYEELLESMHLADGGEFDELRVVDGE